MSPFPILRDANGRCGFPALRPVRADEAEALQAYVRGLSAEARYNRFFGAASELPPAELARALAANDRDRLTLLLTLRADGREIVIGEARVALACAERAGEFGMSLGDGWRGRGLGAALLGAIEQRAAADGIETLFADTLRSNEAMLGLARAHGYRLGPGAESRAVRLRKALDGVAPERPCRKWSVASDTAPQIAA
ncbi:MAG: N-acetyltransferase [Hyphomicrobiales bacterium]|nr:N-acetyltransferase [Hyphomicrobiales bacterium]